MRENGKTPDKLPRPDDPSIIASQTFRLDWKGGVEDITEPKTPPKEPGVNPPSVPRTEMALRPDGATAQAVHTQIDNESRAHAQAKLGKKPRTWQQAIRQLQERLTRKQWFNARSNSPTHQQRSAAKDKGNDGHER